MFFCLFSPKIPKIAKNPKERSFLRPKYRIVSRKKPNIMSNEKNVSLRGDLNKGIKTTEHIYISTVLKGRATLFNRIKEKRYTNCYPYDSLNIWSLFLCISKGVLQTLNFASWLGFGEPPLGLWASRGLHALNLSQILKSLV